MSRPTSAVTRVVLLDGALLAVAIGALLASPGGTGALRSAPWWAPLALAVAFGVSEHAVFHLEHRREAITVSLSEVPSLYALVFLDIRLAIVARLIGSLVVVWVERRPSIHKLLFNAALFTFEIALCGLLMRVLLGVTGHTATWQIVGGVAVVGVVTTVGGFAVSAAIAQFEGGFVEKSIGTLRSSGWLYVLNSTVAGLIVTPSLVNPWLIPLAFVPVAIFWIYVQRQASLSQHLSDVQALQGFSGRVAGEPDVDGIGRIAVVEAARLLRARRVTLFVVEDANRPADLVARASVDVPIPAPQLAPPGPGETSEPTVRIGRVCIAPLVTDGGMVGALAVAGRHGVTDWFTDADLERLRIIAEQLAAPIARGLLHRQLEYDASHDSLTGLENRPSFERTLTGTPATLPDESAVAFVAMLDLDRFKEVNDTLGHHAGDVLLIEVARRLATLAEPGDVVARFAGDEFAVAGTRSDHDAVDEFVRGCTASISRPVRIDGFELVVNASAGIAERSVGMEPAEAIRHADIAMYHAKANHLGHDHYRPEIDRRTPARLSMLGDLRAALEHGEIDVHFQPKLDLVTGAICGAEVLARWHHHSRGWVAPDDFVAVAEQSGLIRQLTDLVLDRTVRTIADLDALGHRLGLAMNLSAHDLLDELLCDRIERHLDLHGVDPTRLTLEITEGTLLYDSPRTRATISRLHDIGVHLSIDDFGTGYSSLTYLRDLPVSELKIDRSFVTNLIVEAQDETIVRSTIDLGHNLGLHVVAEGVETNDVATRLRTLGCDIAQGYGICRPLPYDQLTTWLANTSLAPRLGHTANPLHQ